MNDHIHNAGQKEGEERRGKDEKRITFAQESYGQKLWSRVEADFDESQNLPPT